jgi:hypothetical protein
MTLFSGHEKVVCDWCGKIAGVFVTIADDLVCWNCYEKTIPKETKT